MHNVLIFFLSREKKNICILESFNTNMSHKFFYYKITLVKSRHKNISFKGNFGLKPVLDFSFIYFWYRKVILKKHAHTQFNVYLEFGSLRGGS